MLQVKIPAHELAKGMYVSKLDRPWVETPFLFQGFLIEQETQILSLQEYCEHVYIDVDRGVAFTGERARNADAIG